MGISEQLNNFISLLSVIPPGCCTVVVPSLLKKLVPLPHLAFQRPSHPRHLWFCFGYLVGNIGVHCLVYTSFKKSPVFIHASSLAFVKEILLCINDVFMKAIHACTIVPVDFVRGLRCFSRVGVYGKGDNVVVAHARNYIDIGYQSWC